MKVVLIGHGRFGKILHEKLTSIADVSVATRDYTERLANHEWAVIATPVATHAKIARDCLERGLNVFCEKPLDEEASVVESLIALATKRNVKLYIDDVFLWRQEYAYIKTLGLHPQKISLGMTKYGTFDDSLLSAHIYHDLYLISDLTEFAPVTDLIIKKAAYPLKVGRVDVLEFSFNAGDTFVEASYDRTQEKKEKTITIDDKIIWRDNSLTINGSPETLPTQDALTKMLTAILTKKANFVHNNKLALAATNLLSEIDQLIPTI